LSSVVPAEAGSERLLRMLVALDETVIHLERQEDRETSEAIRRLRLLQGEILSALRLLEGDFSHAG
jgi:hypothetical protein